MQTWLKYDVTPNLVRGAVTVSLHLYSKLEPGAFPDSVKIGSVELWAVPWWHSLKDVEDKIVRAKAVLYNKFNSKKWYYLGILSICTNLEGTRIELQDEKTAEFIKNVRALRESARKV